MKRALLEAARAASVSVFVTENVNKVESAARAIHRVWNPLEAETVIEF
jgi:hypothetical protein